MAKTKVEWSDYSWNPITGCSKVSEGCKYCYAERMARRLAGRHGYPEAPNHFDLTLHPNRMRQPLDEWKKPRTIFVCSMGDFFHEAIPDERRREVWEIIYHAKEHTFLILTKRPENIPDMLPVGWIEGQHIYWPHVWLGVTAENQKRADERIPKLLKIPAAKHFVSVEPMLGRVDLWQVNDVIVPPTVGSIDWLIAGCESGSRRPTHLEWIRDIRDQCVEADIPFFLKQLKIDGKMVKMPELDGRVWDERPS